MELSLNVETAAPLDSLTKNFAELGTLRNRAPKHCKYSIFQFLTLKSDGGESKSYGSEFFHVIAFQFDGGVHITLQRYSSGGVSQNLT